MALGAADVIFPSVKPLISLKYRLNSIFESSRDGKEEPATFGSLARREQGLVNRNMFCSRSVPLMCWLWGSPGEASIVSQTGGLVHSGSTVKQAQTGLADRTQTG